MLPNGRAVLPAPHTHPRSQSCCPRARSHSLNGGIAEHPKLEGTPKDHQVQLLLAWSTAQEEGCPMVTSSMGPYPQSPLEGKRRLLQGMLSRDFCLQPSTGHWSSSITEGAKSYLDSSSGTARASQHQIPFKVNHGWLKPTHLCAGNLQRFWASPQHRLHTHSMVLRHLSFLTCLLLGLMKHHLLWHGILYW